MKKITALALALLLLLSCCSALAKSKRMATDLAPWTEETVRQFTADYIEGKSYDRLYTYLDVQVQRYMPEEFFQSIFVDLYYLTGDFVRQGSYRCFENERLQLKTHVVHLVMEKQDVDFYFTVKNESDDWEIMALEFVPAEREADEEESPVADISYTEKEMVVGSKYPLNGMLTLPVGASASNPVPVCLLLADEGAYDMNMSTGSTAVLADLAEALAKMGIATLRYNNRLFSYPDADYPTVEEEIVEDAIIALEMIGKYPELDTGKIFVFGFGFSGMLGARIIDESGLNCSGLLIAGGTAKTKLQFDWEKKKDTLSDDEYKSTQGVVRGMKNMKEEKASSYTVFGRNGYYYWEQLQHDQTKLLQKLSIPTCIIQSREDPTLTRKEGLVSYQDALGKNNRYTTWMEFRNLNHLLMKDLSTDENGNSTYSAPMNLDITAGQEIANWILAQCADAAEETESADED